MRQYFGIPSPNQPLAEGDVAGMLGGKVALVTDGGHRACHCASHGAEGGRVAVADFDAASARDTVAKIATRFD